MSQFGGVERPGPRETAGDHERRIRALEANPDCCNDLCAGGATTYTESVLADPCLVHYWPADEASGDLVDRVDVWDLAPVTKDGFPQYGAAGPFIELPELTSVVNDGTGGVLPADDSRFFYTFTTAPPFWTGTAPFTIELWLYVTAYQVGLPTVILQAGSGSGITLSLFPEPLTIGRGSDSVVDPDDFPLNEWQYVVVRYDGTTLELLRNGVSVGTDTSGSVTVTGTLSFLNNISGPSWAPLIGRSAQLAIYDCALSDETIAEHYSLQNTGGNFPAGYVLATDGEGNCEFVPSCCDSSTDGTSCMPEGYVLTADGECGTYWALPITVYEDGA